MRMIDIRTPKSKRGMRFFGSAKTAIRRGKPYSHGSTKIKKGR